MGETTGDECICPLIIDPVACANGKTYDNQCKAKCAGAEGCKPIHDSKSHFRAYCSVIIVVLCDSVVRYSGTDIAPSSCVHSAVCTRTLLVNMKCWYERRQSFK